ncbi:MAG: hypothetical protein BWX50_01526 [Euryarchaeota archaeon ADurb.Bin009]|nr:MAG: hypothetical protein BWX50_01526 [Euryarchaeota archaeon ADurb.Bin009]
MDEPDERAAPDHQFFAEPACRRHQGRDIPEHLDCEVPGGDRVHAVWRRPGEAEEPGGVVAVEGETGRGERRRTEGGYVHPGVGLPEPGGIAGEGLLVGEEVVGERRGLGMLQVGEARHHRLRMGGGNVEEGPPEAGERLDEGDEFLLQAYPDTGRDLVVSGPAHVEAAAEVLPGPADEVGLFPGVDVFVVLIERLLREAVVVEVEERRHQRTGRGFVDDPLPREAEEVRHIHEEVRLRDPAVGGHRGEKMLEVGRTLAGKTALPNLIRTHAINSPVYRLAREEIKTTPGVGNGRRAGAHAGGGCRRLRVGGRGRRAGS